MTASLQLRQRAQVLLEAMLGPGSQFRDGQWEAIETVAVQRQRLYDASGQVSWRG